MYSKASYKETKCKMHASWVKLSLHMTIFFNFIMDTLSEFACFIFSRLWPLFLVRKPSCVSSPFHIPSNLTSNAVFYLIKKADLVGEWIEYYCFLLLRDCKTEMSFQKGTIHLVVEESARFSCFISRCYTNIFVFALIDRVHFFPLCPKHSPISR